MISKPSFLLSLLFLLLPLLVARAQAPTPDFTAKNAFFAELYGNNGGRYSLNYDRIFLQRDRFKASFRVGVFAQPVRVNMAGDRKWMGSLPLELNGLWGRSPHHLELGLGFTPMLRERPVANARAFLHNYYGRLGYRYQKPGGGLFFRAGLTPMVYRIRNPHVHQKRLIEWAHGGIGLGWSF